MDIQASSKLRTIILQPTSLCNLNCKYCYISEKERRISDKMELSTLDLALAQVFSSEDLDDHVELVWHAGEPLTAGIHYYRQASELIARHRPKHIHVKQVIQTNGVLINDTWCDLFKEHDIKMGVSIDGPEALHNRNRVNWNGRGSFHATLKGIRYLQKHHIPFTALLVISRHALDDPDGLFHFFLEEGMYDLGFNIEELTSHHTTSSLHDHKVAQDQYLRFMERWIDLWIQHTPQVKIREFERLSTYLLNQSMDPQFVAPQIESSEKGIVTINRMGGITPFSPDLASGVDGDPNYFVVEQVEHLGQWSDVYRNSKFRNMYQAITQGIEKCRQSCDYFSVCGGGHPTNKFFENQSFDSAETQFCRFYIQHIVDILLKKFAASHTTHQDIQKKQVPC